MCFRTCHNGVVVTEKMLLHHGDRILWGNNHFFRINCPRPPGAGLCILLLLLTLLCQVVIVVPSGHHCTKWSLLYQVVIVVPSGHCCTKWTFV